MFAKKKICRFWNSPNPTLRCINALSINRWHCNTVSVDSSEFKLYVCKLVSKHFIISNTMSESKKIFSNVIVPTKLLYNIIQWTQYELFKCPCVHS